MLHRIRLLINKCVLRHGIFAALDQLIWLIRRSCSVESRPLHGRRHRYKSLNGWVAAMEKITNQMDGIAHRRCSWRGETAQRISQKYIYFASRLSLW